MDIVADISNTHNLPVQTLYRSSPLNKHNADILASYWTEGKTALGTHLWQPAYNTTIPSKEFPGLWIVTNEFDPTVRATYNNIPFPQLLYCEIPPSLN